ncbi:MAG: ABC transporter ATP-binding protein [Trueperaceae bacterium]|nr:ABC transporter ATP-binding protein [Trueperaceae bacterium]
MAIPAVEVRRLTKEFVDRRGQVVRAVDDVSLSVREGEFFALLGPSGCGKTTTLRAIAGFEDPTSGEILLRGRPVHGVPPFHRPVNTVFQDYALFPHMTVRQNVMFGLRMARVAADEARRRADQALELVHLPGVGERRPGQLSGGQRQRVALARALVNRPAVLLLDEPLGALDLKLRKAMQYELKQLQQQVGITFVYVTHDQEEALTMADRIAVMSAGKALQVGPPDEVYERPSSRFVADFIGETNFIDGVLEAREGALGIVRLQDGRTLRAPLRDPDATVAGDVAVAVRPEKIDLAPTSGPAAQARRTVAADGPGVEAGMRMSELRGRVVEAHYIGTDTRYRIDGGEGVRLVVRVQNQLAGFEGMLPRGTEVVARWRVDHASVLA